MWSGHRARVHKAWSGRGIRWVTKQVYWQGKNGRKSCKWALWGAPEGPAPGPENITTLRTPHRCPARTHRPHAPGLSPKLQGHDSSSARAGPPVYVGMATVLLKAGTMMSQRLRKPGRIGVGPVGRRVGRQEAQSRAISAPWHCRDSSEQQFLSSAIHYSALLLFLFHPLIH